MIRFQMKNIGLMKSLAILSVIILPVLSFPSHKEQATYAKTTSSQGKVITYELNVRQSADHSSNIIDTVHQGDTFEILQTKNDWDKIKLSNNQIGWVYNDYLALPGNIDGTVTADILRVHENPSLLSQTIDELKSGTEITIQKEISGWAKMVSATGVVGWVYDGLIAKETPHNHPESVTEGSSTMGNKTSVNKKEKTQSTEPNTTSGVQNTSPSKAQNSREPLKGKIIVLDPGHGGVDDGTTSIVGTHEKELTLPTAQDVEQKLENAGANVIMTRTSDTYVALSQRSELSNQNHADAFISFHYNWSNDPSVNGITDFYYQKSGNPLASDIINDVVKTTGLNNDGTRFDNLSVLRNNSQPSTLIELGFLSNKHDDSIVESSAYRDNVAQGIYLGLLDYFSNKIS